MSTKDTIAAIATPSGSGGIGVVRVSGPKAAAILAALLGRAPERLVDRKVVYASARDAKGDRQDEVLAVLMRGPRSYTGEDVAEISGHGGSLNMGRLLRAVLGHGARTAEPGEFTRRAFENGRLDLTAAEAVAAVIGASSERALRHAQAQLTGALGTHADALRQKTVALLSEVEASIDFPEEDLNFLSAAVVAERAHELATAAQRFASGYALGRALREGVEVAFVGAPNVGKSSLMNALLGEERAVVTAEPGTTRDYLEARVVWNGIPVTLIDTAGERAATLEAERRGLALGQARAKRADVRVRVLDATAAERVYDESGFGEDLTVWNKIDLALGPRDALGVSALTGDGLDSLRDAVLARVLGETADAEDGAIAATERQRELFSAAAVAAERAAAAAIESRPLELVAVDLREAARKLAGVSGGDVTESVLDALFARFCIGK